MVQLPGDFDIDAEHEIVTLSPGDVLVRNVKTIHKQEVTESAFQASLSTLFQIFGGQ